MTDFNQKTHDTDVGSHGGQSRQMMEVFENQEFGSIRLLQEAGNNLVSAPELYPALHRRAAVSAIQQSVIALVFQLSGFFRRKERIQRRIQYFRHHVAHRLSPSSNV